MRDQKLESVLSADVYTGMDARNGLPNTLPQAYSSGSEVRCCCDVCRPQMLQYSTVQYSDCGRGSQTSALARELQCYMDEAVTGTLTVQLVRGLFIWLLIVMTAVVHGCCGPSVA
jgi:hypothetical protein